MNLVLLLLPITHTDGLGMRIIYQSGKYLAVAK
jgi:hypothetical protein